MKILVINPGRIGVSPNVDVFLKLTVSSQKFFIVSKEIGVVFLILYWKFQVQNVFQAGFAFFHNNKLFYFSFLFIFQHWRLVEEGFLFRFKVSIRVREFYFIRFFQRLVDGPACLIVSLRKTSSNNTALEVPLLRKRSWSLNFIGIREKAVLRDRKNLQFINWLVQPYEFLFFSRRKMTFVLFKHLVEVSSGNLHKQSKFIQKKLIFVNSKLILRDLLNFFDLFELIYRAEELYEKVLDDHEVYIPFWLERELCIQK